MIRVGYCAAGENADVPGGFDPIPKTHLWSDGAQGFFPGPVVEAVNS